MKKLKKRIASILAATLLLGSCNVYANTQAPHKINKSAEVSYNIVPDDARVKISFEEVTNPSPHDTEGYTIKYQNAYDKKVYESIDISAGSNSITLGENGTLKEEGSLKPGQLYKYWVQPYHMHDIYNDQGIKVGEEKEYANLNDCTPGYFVTEFDTTAKLIKDEEGKQQIQIITQYIPGATYEIYYEKSKVTDYNQIKEVLQTISADSYHDGKGNVVYTLPNPEMGTEYSFYVKIAGLTQGDVFKGNVNEVANIKVNSGGTTVDNKQTVPKVAHVKVGTAVNITSIGKDYIQFSSKFSESFKQKIKYVEIIKLDASNQQTVIGEISQSQFQYDNDEKFYYMNFTYNRPEETTNYLVVFHFADEKVGDKIPEDIITYVPPGKVSEPMRPQVPSAANKEIVNQINLNGLDRYEEYFLKDDAILENKKLNTISINDTFHGYKNGNETGIQFIWSGQRKQGQQVQDPEITYDIWVFKNEIPDNYIDYEPLETGASRSNIYSSSKAVIGFKENLTQYIADSGIKSMVPNATYYIAVRSKNIKDNNKYSDATIVAITLDKDGEISQPSVLGKPPLRVQEENVTDKVIPIEWQKQWYELKAKDMSQYDNLSDLEKELAKQWNSSAYESSLSPKLRWTGNSKDRVGPFSENFVSKYTEDYLSRKITLEDDIKYEVKAISYDEVVQEVIKMGEVGKKYYTTTSGALRVENWINDYENKSQTDSEFKLGWEEVNPTQKESDNSWWQYSVSQYTDLSGAKKTFEANKRYIIMVRTYREVDQGNGTERLYQAFPSYVLGITKNDFKEELPIPNAPILEGVDSTFSSVSVKWEYNYDFEYELRYSRVEDPEQAEVWPFEFSKIEGEKGYVKNGDDLVVTITGLLPDEEYYVWVRAIQKNSSPQLESAWSNGVILKTKGLEAPDVPYGLGLASKQSLLEIGKEINPLSSNYMILEWMRIDADIQNKNENIVYNYQVELSDNEEFTDSIIAVTGEQNISNNANPDEENSSYTAEVLAKNIVQFNNLEANKYYYIRVKTIMAYTRPDTNEVIVKESAYTVAIKLKTATSNGEYDGGENENVVTYPEAIEETYKNGIWTYEIVDAAKVTTQIQANKKYYYTITLKNYKNKYDARIRRIKMPKKVLDTLINQNMALKIVTNIGIYEIPGKALKYYSNQYQATDSVQIDLTRMEYSDIYSYMRSYPEQYEKGEKLEIAIKGSKIYKLDDYMTVKLKLKVVGSYNYSNFFIYQYSYEVGNWNPYHYVVDTLDNSYLTYSTVYTGLNAIYERTIANSNSSASYVMNELTSTYHITGLGTTYKKNSNVSASQYVSLLLGVRLNRDSINLVAGATSNDYEKAKAAGLYISSSRGNITKEQALAGIVKLYEINYGYKIKPSHIVFYNVSMNYREAASKAYAIGLIDAIDSPQSMITYEELCDWLIQVIK